VRVRRQSSRSGSIKKGISPHVRTWVHVEATLLGLVCPRSLSLFSAKKLVAVSSDQDMSPVAST